MRSTDFFKAFNSLGRLQNCYKNGCCGQVYAPLPTAVVAVIVLVVVLLIVLQLSVVLLPLPARLPVLVEVGLFQEDADQDKEESLTELHCELVKRDLPTCLRVGSSIVCEGREGRNWSLEKLLLADPLKANFTTDADTHSILDIYVTPDQPGPIDKCWKILIHYS